MGIEGVGEEPLIPLSHGSSEKESDIVHKNSIGEISERSAAPFPTCLGLLYTILGQVWFWSMVPKLCSETACVDRNAKPPTLPGQLSA